MNMRKFHVNFLRDQLDDDSSELQYISATRWGILYWLLFEVEGETYGVEYESAGGDSYVENFDVDDKGMVWGHLMVEEPTTHWTYKI